VLEAERLPSLNMRHRQWRPPSNGNASANYNTAMELGLNGYSLERIRRDHNLELEF